jgi:hypothetical protein
MIRRNWNTRLCQLLAIAVFSSVTGLPGHSQPQQKPTVNIEQLFTPSGWMGDGEYTEIRNGVSVPKYISFSGADSTRPHAHRTSIKISYGFGPKRWGGIYWQNLPDNWGDSQGSNFSTKGFSRVTFWARGETGSEVVEFKAGGIDRPEKHYRDSFVATTGLVYLSKDWKQYSIDLSGQNLSSVIGGFCWVASSSYNNSDQVAFYLEDITLQ